MFHLAPPLEAGSGVRISTPGWVVPVVDVQRVARPHVEHDGRRGHDAALGVLRGVVRDESGVLDQLDVGVERQRRHIGGKPAITFCACVVLPPNEVENWICWSLCDSFQSDWKVEISLPYTSYTLLYAVTVTIGDSAGVQSADRGRARAVLGSSLEHDAASSRTPRARWRVGRRDETARCAPFEGPVGSRTTARSPVVRSIERTERRGTRPPWVRSAERGYGYQCL